MPIPAMLLAREGERDTLGIIARIRGMVLARIRAGAGRSINTGAPIEPCGAGEVADRRVDGAAILPVVPFQIGTRPQPAHLSRPQNDMLFQFRLPELFHGRFDGVRGHRLVAVKSPLAPALRYFVGKR